MSLRKQISAEANAVRATAIGLPPNQRASYLAEEYAKLEQRYCGAFKVERGIGVNGEIVFYGRGGYATVVGVEGTIYKSIGSQGLCQLPDGMWEIDLTKLFPLT